MELPTPETILAARRRAGLTQTAAGAAVHVQLRTWQGWESGDHTMPLAAWELFTLKTRRKRSQEAA
jgi:putative transcriptional regulator